MSIFLRKFFKSAVLTAQENLLLEGLTDTKTFINRQKGGGRGIKKKRHVSHVMCRLSCVMCHLSLTPTANATQPPPVNSPIIQSRLVCKDPKHEKYSKRKNQKPKNIYRHANISDIHGKHVFPDGTDTQTHRHTTLGRRNLETEPAQRANSMKTKPIIK